MNQTDIGKFIAQCRKEKKLTQAQLAQKLNITDRAVSKWETGKSMPDASIMLELCEILDIKVNELLSGERVKKEDYEAKADENLVAVLKRRDESGRKRMVLAALLFSAVLLVGMAVCVICDVAISGRLTWSPIPVSSILFAWAISFPGMMLEKKKIAANLLPLSIFILPYLFLLSELVNRAEVFSIGGLMAAISVPFLWVVYALFHCMRTKKLLALGITFLLSIGFMLVINLSLSEILDEPLCDIWDILSAFILLVLAVASFICYYIRKKDG